jgi:hypothetical protein
MIRVTTKWKNGKNVMDVDSFGCECGGIMRLVGSAGCPHDENYTYFYQCEKCLKCQSDSYLLPRDTYRDLELYGWKQINPK